MGMTPLQLTNPSSAAGMTALTQPEPLTPPSQGPVFGNEFTLQATATELPTARQLLQTQPNVRFAGTKLGADGEFEVALSPERRSDIVNNKMAKILLDPPTTTYAQLSEGNKKALAHLVAASKALDDVWLKQDHPDNIAARDALQQNLADARAQLTALQESGAKKGVKAAEHAVDEAKDLLTLFQSFNGIEGLDVYASPSRPVALFKNRKQQPGKGVWPTDLSAKELKAYVYAHPEDAPELFSHNTVVRRKGKRLVGVPYSIAFRTEYHEAARHLQAAAELTDNAGLKNYLQWQAAALVNESDPEAVYNADKAWVEMEDTPLEFTIGRESYDDRLASEVLSDSQFVDFLNSKGIRPKKKDFIGTRVGIVNPESVGVIAGYREKLAEFGKHMPGASQYKQSIDGEDGGNKMTFADVDLVSITGDYSAVRGGITVAQNLPNDDKLAVKLDCGSRLAFHRQVRQGGDPSLRQKMLDALVDPEQHKWYDPESDFGFTVGHELGHSLGPLQTDDGRDVIASLGDFGAMLEENKADITSIAMTDYFVKIGKFTEEEANKIYLTWVVGELPSNKPSLDQAHRVRSIMQLQYFIDHGAVEFEAGGKVKIKPEKMGEVGWQMLTDIVNLQRAGNPAKAQAFVDKYFRWDDAMEYARTEKLALKPKMYRVVQQPLAEMLLDQLED